MDKTCFEDIRKNIHQELTEKHLRNAIDNIKAILFSLNNMELSNECESIQKDYELMLGFMQQGGTDPQRGDIFRKLLDRCSDLNEMTARCYRLQNEKDLYTSTYKKLQEKDCSFVQIAGKIRIMQDKLNEDSCRRPFYNQDSIVAEDRRTLYKALDEMFGYIWTSPLLNTDSMNEWQSFMAELDSNAQALLISAIMLGNLEYFDRSKTALLLRFCRNENTMVRARALTGVVWSCMKYNYRVQQAPDLLHLLSLLAREEDMQKDFILLQKQFILSMETVKIEKRMKDEILPELMKNSMFRRNKIDLENIEEELAKTLNEAPNAEWDGKRKDSKLTGYMNEMAELGREGADINIGTFSHLKAFPFFSEISHWFIPFDPNHPEVGGELLGNTDNNPIRLLMNAPNFCDSDKYSLCMMVGQLMPSQREAMLTQIGMQMDGQEEIMKNAGTKPVNMADSISNYLHDMYRFFRLFPQKSSFNDPFKTDLLLTSYPVLDRLVDSVKYRTSMMPFLIKKEYYRDAATYIEEVLKTETATAEILQKLAFCRQRLGNPGKAIYHYQQADLLQPDDKWILRQMYLCYSAMGKYEQKLACLRRLEALQPNDGQLITETGLCLMQLQRYDEAASCFFEAEYKGARELPCQRAIGWCYFKTGKLEQAYKYYGKIMNHEGATWEDYLNAGHTAWCLNNIREAIEHYRSFAALFNKNRKDDNSESPLSAFDKDRNELIEHGISEPDIVLMRDIIAQSYG